MKQISKSTVKTTKYSGITQHPVTTVKHSPMHLIQVFPGWCVQSQYSPPPSPPPSSFGVHEKCLKKNNQETHYKCQFLRSFVSSVFKRVFFGTFPNTLYLAVTFLSSVFPREEDKKNQTNHDYPSISF